MLQHLGREQTVTALDRPWRLSRFDRRIWADWLDWARPLVPHPLEVIRGKLDGLSEDQAVALVEHAADQALVHLQSSSRPVQQLLYSAEGLTQIVYLLAREHQPDITHDDAFSIAMELIAQAGLETIKTVLDRAEGTLPPAVSTFLDALRVALGPDERVSSAAGEAGLGVRGPEAHGGLSPAPVGAGAADGAGESAPLPGMPEATQ